ncbi:hypothetical protein L596_011288 [Steinernema carpocapsae]|uniref:Uncharacterized protein n=1 Tax=Steinernema carpocapsae TaxID=34508 RepID=A0A4U5NTF0_STECR|nr:hypothetical protein L596_011288 [Steinernema carpocapsae]
MFLGAAFHGGSSHYRLNSESCSQYDRSRVNSMAPAPQPETPRTRVQAFRDYLLRLSKCSPAFFTATAVLVTLLGAVFFVLSLAWIVSADADSTKIWLFFAFGIILLSGGATTLIIYRMKLANRRDSSPRRRRRRRTHQPQQHSRVCVDVDEVPARSWATVESQNAFPAPPTYDEAVRHPPIVPTRSTHRASIPPPYRHQ